MHDRPGQMSAEHAYLLIQRGNKANLKERQCDRSL